MPNKVKKQEEKPFIFTPSGNYTNALFPSGSTFIHMDVATKTSQGLVVSDVCDLGTAPRTTIFEWRARMSFASEIAAGLDVELYVSPSNGVYADGGFGSGLPAPSSFNSSNVLPIGTVRYPDSNTVGQASGRLKLTSRYLHVLAYLPSLSGLWDSTTPSYLMLTPMPLEVEDG